MYCYHNSISEISSQLTQTIEIALYDINCIFLLTDLTQIDTANQENKDI